MIPLGGDLWTIRTSTDRDVAFTVWALVRDGLRASVFDSHEDGDGRLRTVGLTANSWLAWFEEIASTASQRATGNERDRTLTRRFKGNEAVQLCLLELWAEHSLRRRDHAQRDFARRTARYQGMTEQRAEALVLHERRFWSDLQRYRPLPPLHIYLVEYPVPVVTAIQPASVVLGLVNPDEDTLEEYSSLIFTGVKLLKQAS